MKDSQLRRLAGIGLLAALIVILGLTPIGLLNVGPIYVTLLCIPVIIGTILMGRLSGVVLGLCFGSVSFYIGMTAISPTEAPILQRSVLYLLILCYLPRILMPLVTATVYTVVQKTWGPKLAAGVAALLGSLTNTVLYLGLVLLFYVMIGLDHGALLAALGGIVLFAGIPEGIVAALVVPPIVTAVTKSRLTSGSA